MVAWGFHAQTAWIVKIDRADSLISYSNVLFLAKCIGFQFKATQVDKRVRRASRGKQTSATVSLQTHKRTQLSNSGLVYVFKTRLVGPVKPEFCRRCSVEGTFVFCALRGRGGRECSSLAQNTTDT